MSAPPSLLLVLRMSEAIGSVKLRLELTQEDETQGIVEQEAE